MSLLGLLSELTKLTDHPHPCLFVWLFSVSGLFGLVPGGLQHAQLSGIQGSDWGWVRHALFWWAGAQSWLTFLEEAVRHEGLAVIQVCSRGASLVDGVT